MTDQEPLVPATADFPEKFHGQPISALAKSYQELERGRSQPAPTPPATPPAPPPHNRLAPQPTGDPLAAYAHEFSTTGTLSATSKREVEAIVGPGRAEMFMTGFKAIQSQAQAEAFAIVGGEEKYDDMLRWAQTNLKPNELAAFEQSVSTDNPAVRDFAIRGLHTRYTADPNQQAPNLVQQGGPANPSGVYPDRNALSIEQRDPLYKTPGPEGDAFRAKVMAKVTASRNARIPGFA